MRGWFRRRYEDAARAHYTPILEEYERLLGEARDQLATKEAERVAAVARGDDLMDKLLEMAGMRGITPTARAAETRARDEAQRFLAGNERDMFEEIEPGTDCVYATAAAALIDPCAVEPEEPPKETTH